MDIIDTGRTVPPSDEGFCSHDAIRKSVVSANIPRSSIFLDGGDAFDFLHRMSTNDVKGLADGASRRTVIVNEKGRVIDLVTVARRGTRAVILGSGGCGETLSSWFDRFIIMDDVKITLHDDTMFHPAIYGPGAPGMIERTGGSSAVAREDLGCVPGYLIVPGAEPETAPKQFLDACVALKTIDGPSLEAVRIEEMVPSIGRELGPEVNALEAGLKGFISFSKGCYIGQEVIARLDTYKKLRTILALFSIESAAGLEPFPGTLLQGDREAGRITSVARSPLHGGWIGLGFREIAAESMEFRMPQGDVRQELRCRRISALPTGYENYGSEE
jgi:folate-binding protein YgfZ